MNLHEIFLQMKKLPKGLWIDNPYEQIPTDFTLSKNILKVLNTPYKTVSFTRLSMKHLAEKGNAGEYLLNKMRFIIESPDAIYLGNFSNRFLLSKSIIYKTDNKAHVITIEITENQGNILITSFISKEAYFKNLKLLWGTASSPSQQSL